MHAYEMPYSQLFTLFYPTGFKGFLYFTQF
jgi:hypothetical protein